MNLARERSLGQVGAGAPVYRQWTPGPIAVRFSPVMAPLGYRATLAMGDAGPPSAPFDGWHIDSCEWRNGARRADWSQATRLPPPGP